MAGVFLLNIAGGVALLVWGLHMIQTGITRAYGGEVRRILGAGLHNPFRAFAAGLGITALLQSSTATALLTASFAATDALELSPALAVMLGANVGSTLLVQAAAFNITAAAPALIMLGVAAFKRGTLTRARDLGRAAIGLGLVLLALRLLLENLETAVRAPAVSAVLPLLNGAPALGLACAGMLAWLAHSSIAVVLLIMSLASTGVVTPATAIAMVAGANLGSALNPVLEGGSDPVTRRMPLGNLFNRLAGAAIVVLFADPLGDWFARESPTALQAPAIFHTAFNLVLALAFFPLLKVMAAALTRLLPKPPAPQNPAVPRYLDESAVPTPAVALACAVREALRAADIIETMLRQAMIALLTNDRKLAVRVSQLDKAVDRLDEAIKLYVTRITRQKLGAGDAARALEIIVFSLNLEHIGDIIDKNLMELAAKKIKYKLTFSDEGERELADIHGRVVENLKLAASVFMAPDVTLARRLVEEKAALRAAARYAAENHLGRLRAGRPESVETSSLHLDILRDLKRIHAHICEAAYPVLEAAGELRPSRLREPAPESC